MELSKEFIEKHNLTQEAVTGINESYQNNLNEVLPAKELEYETKYKGKANEQAEGILNGAAEAMSKKFGFSARADGEKIADYLTRGQQEFGATLEQQRELSKKGIESEEYKNLLAKNDDNLKKLANFEELTAKADKYDTLSGQMTQMKVNNAFSSIKPQFPDTVNEYEAEAKWSSFVKDVQSKYSIEEVDGKYVGVDKENKFKTVPLADLVKASDSITELSKARDQGGLGLGKDKITIKDVPFSVPKDATSTEKSNVINGYLNEQKITGDKRDAEFAKLWKLLQ